ncbi:thiamine-phosphate kinase [Hydrogenivirga sp. 128-5-R1-1]|uniref:thiamine-phosphate kinase n=1 Tax=Hydrogenivirga sp. 128-5-R1-1 TaxID=392423 RepID=UPI00015EFB07|nr:thiamine-phosphate kinase [Hydrogenivirga sp. 128-5-R1-1]EDP73669.1 thiamine monophosphate kinase [Hydrogenivirga sp. 128-5-R1-1]
MKGEFKLIDRLTKYLPINDKDVIVGFGDDCACVKIENELLIFTADIQVENHHFIKEKIKPENLGWKLVSVNVSDVVACGGIPKWGIISIAVPKNTNQKWIEKVYKGIKEALNYYKFNIIGGNTSASEEIIFDLFLTGKTKRFVSRSSAKEGQSVYISGETGLSRAGLELLLMDKKRYEKFEKELIEKHVKPKAKIDLQKTIEKYAESCIDISDGLVGDLRHVSTMSSVKIIIEKDKLPVHPLLEKFCRKYKKDPYQYILYGGEDYELAFTVDSKNEKHIKNCYKIGKVEKGKGIYLIENNKKIHLKEEGFEHI